MKQKSKKKKAKRTQHIQQGKRKITEVPIDGNCDGKKGSGNLANSEK